MTQKSNWCHLARKDTPPTMKILLFASAATTNAFAFTGAPHAVHPCRLSTALSKGYVPDGLSEDEYRAQKWKDSHKPHAKHFKSRDLVDFQLDLDAGKVRHQFPVMFAKVSSQKSHFVAIEDIRLNQKI